MDKSSHFSFAGILKFILGVVLVIGIIWQVLVLLAFLVTMIDPGSKANLFSTSAIYSLRDVLPAGILQAQSSDPAARIDAQPYVWIIMKSGTRGYLLLTMIGYFSWVGLFFIIILQLRRFLATVKAGNPFCRENASRIRTIGWSIVAAYLLKTAGEISAVAYMKQTISVNGHHLFSQPFWLIWEYLRFDQLFAGFVVLAISGIFRLGTRLKEEQELTV